MCGIVGYTGYRNARNVILNCLKKLEYRGYDSAGIAIANKDISIFKETGEIKKLTKNLFAVEIDPEKAAEEYKKLSLAVNRHRRLIAVIVDSAVSELKESIKNVILSQKRMIEIMNKRIKEIEEMMEKELKKK